MTTETKMIDTRPSAHAAVPRWLTVRSAAQHTGVSTRTIHRMLKAEQLKAHRPTGRRVLIDREQLDQVIIESAE